MKKEEMTMPDMLSEAVGIVAAAVYTGLQIYYGILYKDSSTVIQILRNLLVLFLVYFGLTLFQLYPEWLNHLTKEACTGQIKRTTIVMVRVVKLIVILSLTAASFCDVLGITLKSGTGWIIGAVTGAVIICQEAKIIRLIKEKLEK